MSNPALINNLLLTPQTLANPSALSAAFSNALSNSGSNPDVLSNELRALTAVLDGGGLGGQNPLAELLKRHSASDLAAHRDEFVQALQKLPVATLQEAAKKLELLMAAHSASIGQRFLSSEANLELAKSVLSPLNSRISNLPESAVTEVQTRLSGQWQAWEGKNKLPPEVQDLLLAFLPHYARVALAHLGRETPEYLPYLNEIFFKAIAEYQAAEGKEWPQENRGALIRFLSSQPGRLGTETFSKQAPKVVVAPPNLTGDETRQLMGNSAELWEIFLKVQSQQLSVSPLELAQIYQRSLSLMHFYVSYSKSKLSGVGFADLPFDPEIYQRVLKDTQNHPYPSRAREIFERFFREILDQEIKVETQPIQNPQAYEANPLFSFVPRYEPVQPGETWAEFLRHLKPNPNQRHGIKTTQLDAADLGVAGSTIFNWGSVFGDDGHLVPPGNILLSLGVKFFLNALGEVGVDPFDASRLMNPEQLGHFIPDENGEIVIRYSALLKGLSYEHFRIGALLQAYLRTRPEAGDIDLAAQWGVSLSTVGAYRRGEYHKMQRETLERLAKSLAKDESQELEIKKLLMFLRYRPDLDASIPIYDQDGVQLNKTPPQPSRYRLRLIPDDAELRPLDTTRRIQFEKEPFASALNGTVDFALNLLERRLLEAQIFGETKLSSPPDLSVEAFQKQIQTYRDAHMQHFQVLAQHEKAPGVIRPGQIKEIQGFYRQFFKFFEEIYLHARAQGEITLGAEKIPFEIVPPTKEQIHGVRWIEEAEKKAYVVAQDVFEDSSLDNETRRAIIQLRVLEAYLKTKNQILPGDEVNNRQVMKKTLEAAGFTGNAQQVLENFERLEQEVKSGKQVILDIEAMLHKITRGRLGNGGIERRRFHWEQDLHRFLIRNQIASLEAPMRQVFQAYLEMVPHPFRGFEPQRFDEALVPLMDQQGNTVGETVQQHLLHFMETVGLPIQANTTPNNDMTIDGFANAALATYIARIRSEHPLRSQGKLFIDPDIIQRVVEDRLIDFPHLKPHEEELRTRLTKLIEDYNNRTPPIKIYEIAGSDNVQAEPFGSAVLSQSFEQLATQYPQVNRRLVYAALGELKGVLAQDKLPEATEIQKSLETSSLQLQRLGMPETTDLPMNLRFLEAWTLLIHQALQSASRLATEISPFVQQKIYHSELTDAKKLGEDMEKIFKLYTRSALLDTNPLILREATLRVLGNRFDAYPTLREDVVRGMRVIFHELLENFQKQYEQFTEYFEVSFEEAKADGDVEKFWKVFLEYSGMKDRESLEQKISDLEKLRDWMLPAPIKLSDQMTQAILELNETKNKLAVEAASAAAEAKAAETQNLSEPEPAPTTTAPLAVSFDPEAILATAVPADILAKYPELELVEEAKFQEVLGEVAGLGWDWTCPQGRSLLQILGLMRTYPGMETTESGQAILLEVQGALSQDSVTEVWKRVLNIFENNREELFDKIDPFSRLGLLPEIRSSGPKLNDDKTLAGFINFISRRQLSEKFFQELQQIFRRVAEKTASANEIAQFYFSYRDRILQAPLISMEGWELPSNDATSRPSAMLERLDREAPELNGLNFQFYAESPHLNRPEFYLYAMAVSALFHFFPKKDLEHVVRLDQFVKAMTLMEASQPHGAIWATDQMMKIYANYRPKILKKLVQEHDIKSILEVFPEIKNQTLDPIPVAPGAAVRFAVMPGYETTAKVMKAMEGAWAVKHHRKALEKIFWGLKVASIDNSPHRQGSMDDLKRVSGQLMQYYLDHREEFLKFNTNREASAERNENALESFWELQSVSDQDAENNLSPLSSSIEQIKEEVGWGSFLEPGAKSWTKDTKFLVQLDKHYRIFSYDEKRRMDEQLERRGYATFPEYPGEKFTEENTQCNSITPFTLLKSFLPFRVSPELAKLHLWFATLDNEASALNARKLIANRAAILIGIGINPEWVMGKYSEDYIKLYQSRRNAILDGHQFAPTVAQLPEVRAGISLAQRKAKIEFPVNQVQGALDSVPPVISGLHLLLGLNEATHGILRELERVELHAIKQNKLDKDLIELITEEETRIYLKNRKNILPLIKQGLAQRQSQAK